jgi:hypothetical protein
MKIIEDSFIDHLSNTDDIIELTLNYESIQWLSYLIVKETKISDPNYKNEIKFRLSEDDIKQLYQFCSCVLKAIKYQKN